MIEIYGTPASRAFRVYWTLEELGLDYEMKPLSPGENTNNKEFYKINPNGKIPALKEGEFCLFESAAICYYLCTKKEEQNLLPSEGSQNRALVDQWIFWVQGELEQVPWTLAKHKFVYPEKCRVEGVREGALYEWKQYKEILESYLVDRNFILGEQFSLADIFIAHTLNWAKKMDLLNEKDEILNNYINKSKARDSFSKAKALIKKA